MKNYISAVFRIHIKTFNMKKIARWGWKHLCNLQYNCESLEREVEHPIPKSFHLFQQTFTPVIAFIYLSICGLRNTLYTHDIF